MLILAGLFSLVGCSPQSEFALDAPGLDTSNEATTNVDSADNAPSTDLPELPVPVYWSLAGTLVVGDSGLDLEGSEVRVNFWTDQLEPSCESPTVLPLEEEVDSDVDLETVPAFAWFPIQVGVTDALDTACPGWPAGTVELGLGPDNGLLDPAVASKGWDQLSLHGLYVRLPPTPTVYVIGVAGTDEMFRGEANATNTAPLPAGAYRLESLIVMDL